MSAGTTYGTWSDTSEGNLATSRGARSELATIRPEGAKSGPFTRGGQASSLRAAGTGMGTRTLLPFQGDKRITVINIPWYLTD